MREKRFIQASGAQGFVLERAPEEVHFWKGAGEEVASRHYLSSHPKEGLC